jgi:hypothetical protein
MTTAKQTIAYATRLLTACSRVSRGMLLRMLRSMLVHVLVLAFVIRHGDVYPGLGASFELRDIGTDHHTQVGCLLAQYGEDIS